MMMEGLVQLHGSITPAFWNKLESLKKSSSPKPTSREPDLIGTECAPDMRVSTSSPDDLNV